jgi:hypothetical protein
MSINQNGTGLEQQVSLQRSLAGVWAPSGANCARKMGFTKNQRWRNPVIALRYNNNDDKEFFFEFRKRLILFRKLCKNLLPRIPTPNSFWPKNGYSSFPPKWVEEEIAKK